MEPKPTPKPLLYHIIGALVLIITGVIWLFLQWRADGPASEWEAALPHALVLGGFAWYAVTRLRIWRRQRD
ncbi:hypothetical protein ACN2MM_03735 [Alkalilimnicola ehrlichii MLHE-1]|uniref:Transmembrane protein n=1 Tax=Alkalilimnicola ehrlichii (strain ATCC BAA-1101 / DSM 17681 / MLHE-1) TaxID=187272 RepID=Q0AB12_ALKEH|nr:hypothetical protein [Alkalilimnicola ehrlichii]ABI55975.1 hypothetical protein Mlg_0621 [Alkalilimnicola ehrlichii MLHE-1]